MSCSAYDRRAGIGGDKDIASGPITINGGEIKTKTSSYGGRTDYAGCITTPGYGGAAIGNGTDARSEGIARIKGTEQNGPKIFVETIRRYFSGGHYPGVVAIGARAVSFMAKQEKYIVEPSSALTVAAVMDHAERIGGTNIALVLSGGNIDGDLLTELMTRY